MFKVGICDDELNEAAVIKQLVEEFMNSYGILYDIQIFLSGEDLIASSASFDFVFLDISMGGMNGIEAGMKLYQRNVGTSGQNYRMQKGNLLMITVSPLVSSTNPLPLLLS